MPVIQFDVNQKFQRALALHQRGLVDQAKPLYEEVLKAQPAHADALQFLGVIELQLGNVDGALGLLTKSVGLNAKNPGALLNLGNAQKELQQYEAAVKSYDKAIKLKNDFALAYCNKGVALQMLGRLEAAVACFSRSIALNPGGYEAYYNLANLQKDTGSLDAAVVSYSEAIARNPVALDVYLNRSAALLELRQLTAAVDSFDQAIAVDPTCAKAHWNKSLVLLLAGRYAEAWPDYEWRWRIGVFAGKMPRFEQPAWRNTEPIEGKTILLHAEQGLGDTLQFCRYSKLLAALGATVVLEVQPPLVGLLRSLDSVSEVIALGSPLPHFDIHCPLLSLPLAFNTTLETIPNETPYCHSDPVRVKKWSSVLGHKAMPRVGLVWSGNKDLIDDHTRSIELAALLPHLSPGFDYVSLQKDLREVDEAVLNASGIVRHFGADLVDFADTAALCDLMDIVISVDTSVAHLSGAMGKRTLVLLSHIPDWRWLLDRVDSPWYSSAALYRQTAAAQWGPVLEQIGIELARVQLEEGELVCAPACQ